MLALRTYDVFDTCITRIVGEPVSVFRLLGQDLVQQSLWKGTAEQFASARVEAETRARIHTSPREVRFSEIYEELQSAYALAPSEAEQMAGRELVLERTLLRAVPGILEELDKVRSEGCTVRFISDMYLPHETVQSWLLELGVMRADESLWISSRQGATKGDGGLFDLVRSGAGGEIGSWTHAGDNAWSDVAVPVSRGIAGRHIDLCHLTASERVMEHAAAETCGLASLLAGAARWARVSRPKAVDLTLNDMAADIGAPVIYAFVHWVLLEARRRSLKKIWFMARDGQVMLPVARIIAERLGLADIELGYLYGGRQVVRVASLVGFDDRALDWLTGGAGVMTLQAVLDRVGVSVSDVRSVAEALGLPAEGTIGWDHVSTLKTFLQHPDVAPLILAQAGERRSTVLDYFRECGLIDGGPCAVVDIGWKGNVLRSIVDLIGAEAASRHTFMYFGSYAHAQGCERVPKVAYLFDVRGHRRFGVGDDIPSMTTLMEVFCQADHGQVMQMRREAGRFVPQCRPADDTSGSSRWNVPDFQRAVVRFAEAVPIERFSETPVDLRSTCDRLLRRLAVDPTAAEIDLLASIGFVDDQGGSQPQPFAHAYRWSHLRLAYRSGESRPRLGLNWWSAAAAALTPPVIRWCMRLAAKAGRMRAQRRTSALHRGGHAAT